MDRGARASERPAGRATDRPSPRESGRREPRESIPRGRDSVLSYYRPNMRHGLADRDKSQQYQPLKPNHGASMRPAACYARAIGRAPDRACARAIGRVCNPRARERTRQWPRGGPHRWPARRPPPQGPAATAPPRGGPRPRQISPQTPRCVPRPCRPRSPSTPAEPRLFGPLPGSRNVPRAGTSTDPSNIKHLPRLPRYFSILLIQVFKIRDKR